MVDTEINDEKAPEAESVNADGDQAEPPIMINSQYVKDLTFEAPATPGIFSDMHQQQPEISFHINVEHNLFKESMSEVVLEIEAHCTIGDDIAFVVELKYGGVFTINVPDEDWGAMVMIECPRLLFPFARNIMATITREAGFPPLMLGHVDFVSMYQNHLQQEGSAATAES